MGLSLSLWMLSLSMPALAVPGQFTHQGRLLDDVGEPIDGDTAITFRLIDEATGGSILWEEEILVGITNGFFSAILGAHEDENPLDIEVLDQAPLWLELQVTGSGPMFPRQSVHSVPYASMAGVAEEVQGGPVDASEIAVSGALVIDADGQWVGTPPTVSWSDLTDVPEDHADGSDTDTLASLAMSCIDGDVARWDAAVGDWICSEDWDIFLSGEEVREHVSGSAIDLSSGSTIGGVSILSAADTVEPGWTDLTGVPDGFADGEDADSLAATACGDGEILVYSIAGGSWACGEDTDETLSASEVQSMVEAMTGLALGAGTTIDGQAPRLAGESVAWSDLSDVPGVLGDLDCDEDQIVVFDEGAWSCSDLADRFDADLDGVMVWADCDDSDPTVFSEDGDHDCDGVLTGDDCDDYDPDSTIRADDGDCDSVLTADDCDDSDPTSYPGAVEVCDGADNDCDGTTDEGYAGTGPECPAESCAAILDLDGSSFTDDYYVRLGGEIQSLRCDMSTDGGGWTRIYANDFEDGDTEGWSFHTTTTCGEWGRILGGYDETSTEVVRIDLDSDITHSQVMVKGHYMFIDTWDSEVGYMNVDGGRIWDTRMSHSSGGSTCGRSDSTDERHYITEIDSHTASTLEFSAGSTLDQAPSDESYGIDDIEVWIR